MHIRYALLLSALFSSPTFGQTARIIEIPQQDGESASIGSSENLSLEPSGTTLGERIKLAQMPPPPFYIQQPYPLTRQRSETGSSEFRQPAEFGQHTMRRRQKRNELALPMRPVDGQAVVGTRAEPNYSLTRHMKGSYKDRINALLDQPQAFPQPNGPLLLVVSVAKQTVTVYDSGVQFAKSPVSTGTLERPTPLGVFTVLEKQWWHRSNMYSSAPMPFMQRITWDGVALHAGELPGHRASHGCVRLPESFAYRLWYTSSVGARVVISWNDVVPTEVQHPLLFQPLPPAIAPEPEKPQQISPREFDNAPVSLRQGPNGSARILTALIDDDSYVPTLPTEDEESAFVRPVLAFGEMSSKDFEAQPVLEMFSARKRMKRRDPRNVLPEYEASGIPRPEPISILISRRDSRIYVRKGMQPLFDAPITIARSSDLIGTHVFNAVSIESGGKLRWMAVSPTTSGNEPNEEEGIRSRRGQRRAAQASAISSKSMLTSALDRIALPEAVSGRINGLISVGATLIISDTGIGRLASVPDTDFNVLLRN